MRAVALSVVLVVLLAVGATPLVAAGVSETAPDSHTERQLAVDDPTATSPMLSSAQLSDDTPSTTFTINLRSDRDADWVVIVEYELETDAQQAAFDSLAEEFEADGHETDHEAAATPAGIQIGLYENLAALASERTDREMRINDVERSATREGGVGTLELSFRWSEFLEEQSDDEDDEQLVLNDALGSPGEGTWLTSLGENQKLRITTPDGYAITSANVAFSQNTVEIEGPHTFDPADHIRITLEPSAFGGVSWELLAAAVVVAAAIIGGALLLRRRDVDPTAAAANGGVDAETATQSADSPASAPGPVDGLDDPDSSATESTADPPEDLSLLADDERVLRLLARNGGRMRQADIVSETKWSDAKVSQLLSSMADDDQITKLRIGRENLISLPDVDALDGSKRDDDS